MKRSIIANKVLSIEIGQTLTKVCEVDYGGRITGVHNCFHFLTPEDMLEDGYIKEYEEFSKIFHEKCNEYHIRNKKVIFTISSTKVANREVTIPFVKENRIRDIIHANSKEYFPVDTSKYQFSHVITDVLSNEDKKEKKYKLLVLAAPNDLIQSYYELAAFCGLSIVSIDYNGNSLYQAIKNQSLEGTSLMIKADENSAFLLVLRNQSIVLQRTITYGVDAAVEAVMETGLKVEKPTYLEALEILRTKNCIGTSLDVEKEIPEEEGDLQKAQGEVTDSLRYLVNNIIRVIDYYNSNNKEFPVEKIWLTGLGGDIIGFDKLLSFETGHEVTVLRKINASNVEKALKAEPHAFGEYVTSIGAAISPLGFIQEPGKDKRDTKEDGKNNRLGIIVLIGGVLIGLVLIVSSLFNYGYISGKKTKLEKQVADMAPVEAVYEKYQDVKLLYDNMSVLEGFTITNNDDLLEFIKELEKKLPTKINVLSFTATREMVTMNINVTSKEEAAKTIMQLRTFESLSNVSVSGLTEYHEENGNSTVSFSAICTYKPIASLAGSENLTETDIETEEIPN